MPPVFYLVVAFVGVIATFFFNNHLQKKLITIQNKEKAVDFLLENLKSFESSCVNYWQKDTHDSTYALDIRVKYKQLSIFVNFAYQKYSLQDKQVIEFLLLKLFKESTGDDFDSKNRTTSEPKKIIEISKISNNIVVKFLQNKI